MQIAINFEQTYPPTFIAEDLTEMKFNALQSDGNVQQIFVKISKHPDPLLPDVYNLGFGPPIIMVVLRTMLICIIQT
ncbi:hypothetical protein [Pedobacter miscanthi]|jgi:hypothetical protein|uniref:hypothetical protein n=1 Tax=Pedobacter miscanthi TaxID=2259170 RepID=UPI00292D2275|nr:hypothetical protein [Pedobacter miscanthi]